MSRNRSLNFKKLVESFHAGLFRFARCLSGEEQTAADLVQHTFYIYANKGADQTDPAKLKRWFYATLYSEFQRQRTAPQVEPRRRVSRSSNAHSRNGNLAALDGEGAAVMLDSIEEPLRIPLAMFYLRELDYHDTAEILGLPLPELFKRLAAGKTRLKSTLAQRGTTG